VCHRMNIRIPDSPHTPLPLTPAFTTPASYPRPSIAGTSSASSSSLSRSRASSSSMRPSIWDLRRPEVALQEQRSVLWFSPTPPTL
jgi:hypothetical protein